MAPRPEHTKSVSAHLRPHRKEVHTSCLIWLYSHSAPLPLPQVYTRSVIDPLPPPATTPDGDAASKAADRQKKKGKMTDEEIMDKLSMGPCHLANRKTSAIIIYYKPIHCVIMSCSSLLPMMIGYGWSHLLVPASVRTHRVIPHFSESLMLKFDQFLSNWSCVIRL